MFEKDVYEQFRLRPSRMLSYRGYHAFYEKGDLYIVVSVPSVDEDEIIEMKQMGDYLSFQKEDRLAQFVPTIDEKLIATINGEQVVIYKMTPPQQRTYVVEGEGLARFHQKGMAFPYALKSAARHGQWKNLWETRLDQLEDWWTKRIVEPPANQFEKMFFETFPYFLGVTENAIQYIVDCEWEDPINELNNATICHVKHKPGQDIERLILPTELVYDHPSRDLAEWIRYKFFERSNEQEIVHFLNDYERIMPISMIAWRLVFGRLLFPSPYFEMIEGYYSSQSDNERKIFATNFLEYCNQVESYEVFLGSFFKNIGLPLDKLQIPVVHWLHKDN